MNLLSFTFQLLVQWFKKISDGFHLYYCRIHCTAYGNGNMVATSGDRRVSDLAYLEKNKTNCSTANWQISQRSSRERDANSESGCDNPMKDLKECSRGDMGTRGYSSMQLGGNWKPLTVDKRKKTTTTILTQQRHSLVAWRLGGKPNSIAVTFPFLFPSLPLRQAGIQNFVV